MDDFKQLLQQLFDGGQRFLADLSARWHQNTNRRTLVIAVTVGTACACAYLFLIAPPEEFPVNKLVSVPEGQSVSEIGDTLTEQGVIRSPLTFRLLSLVMADQHAMHAGDYLFKEPRDVFSVVRAIAIGQFGLEPTRIRIPEGATTMEMAAIYSNRLERFSKENFLAQTRPSMEGYLFPDTYFFLPNATEDTVIQAMRQNFDEKISEIQPLIASSTRSLSDIVIMASIVEREAFNTKDRRLISGVLWNRMQRGMMLQVDVTFAYTIGKGTFQLTMTDLKSDSPYNTYRYKGLPPTPIGSPSLDSLIAALTPTKSDYLYFLADRNGVTHYCKDYACQVANKAKYF